MRPLSKFALAISFVITSVLGSTIKASAQYSQYLSPEAAQALYNCAARDCASGIVRGVQGAYKFRSQHEANAQRQFIEWRIQHDREQQLKQQRDYCAKNGCHYRQ
jgi:hypothetical protein